MHQRCPLCGYKRPLTAAERKATSDWRSRFVVGARVRDRTGVEGTVIAVGPAAPRWPNGPDLCEENLLVQQDGSPHCLDLHWSNFVLL
jgi:hypothetical protein